MSRPNRRCALIVLLLSLCVPVLSLPAAVDDKKTEYDGEVQNYEPGNLLTIRKRPRVEVKYDLTKRDIDYSIEPGVRKGSKVSVTEADTDAGRHQITVRLKNDK